MDSVDICNLALNFLGKGRIDSLSDNNELASSTMTDIEKSFSRNTVGRLLK